MLWIMLFVMATAAVVAVQLARPRVTLGRPGLRGQIDSRERTIALAGPAVVVYAALLLASILLFSVHVIPYGNVGIVRTFGAITSVKLDDGLAFTWPWQDFETENIQTQSLLSDSSCYNGRFKNCFETFSKESIDVFITGVLNFHIDPENVRTLREKIGPNYREKIVLPRMNQVLKDETVKYAAVDITPNREAIRNAVRDRLTRELAADGIAVEDFLLKNVEFKDEVKAAIDEKVIAAQRAQAAEQQVAVAAAEARQKAAAAEGEANRLRIEAQGQADANRTISESLTPALIQFQAVQKLAGNIQIALLPAGQGLIIDPASLLSPPR